MGEIQTPHGEYENSKEQLEAGLRASVEALRGMDATDPRLEARRKWSEEMLGLEGTI